MADNAYLIPFVFIGLLVFITTLIDIRVGLCLLAMSIIISPEYQVFGKPIRPTDLLLVIILIAWITLMATRGKRFVKTPLNIPILIFIFINLLSLLNAFVFGNLSPVYATPQSKIYSILVFLKKVQYLLIFFLVINTVKDLRHIKFFVGMLILASIFVSIYAIYLSRLHPVSNIELPYRVGAPYDPEPNTFGQYLYLHLLLIVALIFSTRNFNLKIGLIALVPIVFFAFTFTYSRASYFGLLAAFATLIILSRNMILIAAAIILIIFSSVVMPPAVVYRIESGFQEISWWYQGAKEAEGTTFITRVASFKEGFTLGIKKPLIGYGIGTFPLQRIEAQLPREVLETGFIGLGIFLWIIYIIIKTNWETAKATKDEFIKWLSYAMISGIIGYMVSGFAAIPFTTIRTAEPFWFLCGLTFVCHKLVMQKKDNHEFVEYSYQRNKVFNRLSNAQRA